MAHLAHQNHPQQMRQPRHRLKLALVQEREQELVQGQEQGQGLVLAQSPEQRRVAQQWLPARQHQ